MNDPNKVINVNLSSLLSLKAELLRKQAEVSKAKATRTTADEYVASRASVANSSSNNIDTQRAEKKNKKKSASVEETKQNDATVYEHEDTELMAKSQRVLVAKSKFYERMTHSGGRLNSDDNCLVQFNRKKQENTNIRNEVDDDEPQRSASSSSDEETDKDGDDECIDSDEDFVEYVDCLGRTRKCVRKRLDEVLRRDRELSHNINPDGPGPRMNKDVEDVSKPMEETYTSIPGPLPPMSHCDDDIASVASTQHDEQRAAWERKEAENLDKTDVHYQDVFFDEARQHGVGYYAFSTDEEERKRQQRELEEERRQTVSEQERRDAQRAQRERIIAERVLAAKNRQRARLGLPPLDGKEEEEKKQAAERKDDETKAERKERKRAEKLERKKEKEAYEREQERLQHVRPWDAEKEGVAAAPSSTSGFKAAAGDEDEWAYKPERGEPMSQEQWNAQKRAERNPEFAPISNEATSTKCAPAAPLKRTNFSNSMPPPPPPAAPAQASYAAQYNAVAPPPQAYSDTFVNFQSTRRDKPQFQRRSYESEATTGAAEASVSRGAAIPPPASLDAYTLPSAAKKSKSSSELERSIEAGLRFLRNNCDKETPTGKSSWTAKADY